MSTIPLRGPARGTRWLVALALVVATCAAYEGVVANGLLWWDDAVYVGENAMVRRGLTPASIAWAFTTGTAANWHPLTWLSHELDVTLFGVDAGAMHLVSLSMHVASALLLARLLVRWTGRFWPSWFVAGVFALHPLHVESVAWIAERKDVLSHLLFVLMLTAWTGWAQRASRAGYLLAFLLYALGLMAKPMLVTVPLLLLVLDGWPFRRVLWPGSSGARGNARPVAALLLEKAPFAVLALASSIVTVLVQRAGGAMDKGGGPNAIERTGNAFASVARYVEKAFVPVELSPFYAWRSPWSGVAFWVGIVLVPTVLAIGWFARGARPWVWTGWLWFLLTLVPVLGFVQVGDQAFADRYTYVPLTGLAIAVTWSAAELASWLGVQRVLGIAGVVVLASFGALTARQVRLWHDDVALFTHAVELDPANATAHKVLGKALVAEKRLPEGIEHLRKATELRPDYAEAWWNLGVALGAAGRPLEAIPALERAREQAPWIADIHYNLGLAYASVKREDDARACFTRTLELDSAHFGAHGNLGLAARARGDLDLALRHFQAASRARPDDPAARRYVALTELELGQVELALRDHADVLRSNPRDLEQATEAARRAIETARSRGREADARTIEELLARLRAGPR